MNRLRSYLPQAPQFLTSLSRRSSSQQSRGFAATMVTRFAPALSVNAPRDPNTLSNYHK